MSTLQKTFKYKGDVTKSPVKEVILKFRCPVFKYELVDFYTGNKTQNFSDIRKIVGFNTTDLKQDLSLTTYKAEIPASNIIGEDLDSALFFYAYIQAVLLPRRSGAMDIDAISLSINVQFSNEDGDVFGGQQIEAGYFIKNFAELVQKMQSHSDKNIAGNEAQVSFFDRDKKVARRKYLFLQQRNI